MTLDFEAFLYAPPAQNDLNPPHIFGAGDGIFSIAERKTADELYQILKSTFR